jgi:hypothetical protein
VRYAVLGFYLTVTCLTVPPVQAQVHVNMEPSKWD